VGKGHNSLRYLARYVFRVAISNNRIKSIKDNAITFTYKDRERKTWKTMELKPMEFIPKVSSACIAQGVYEDTALWISESKTVLSPLTGCVNSFP